MKQNHPSEEVGNIHHHFKIVIIEDDDGLGKLIQLTLQREGFSAILATTGEEALSTVQGENNEILLVDYKLPDMSGKQLILKLQEKYGYAPNFVTLTGYGDEKTAVDMMKLGSRDYIVKEQDFIVLLLEVLKRACADLNNEIKLQETEASLKKTLNLLRETGDMVRLGGWEVDVNTNKVYWTETTKTIHEVPEDYTPDLSTVLDFFPGGARKKIQKGIDEAIKNGKSYSLELPFVSAKGNKLWVVVKGNPQMENGKCVHLRGTIQDITERKKKKERLKTANQLLAESEQQLRAANQQLAANEQQLLAANQQLIRSKEKAEEADKLKSAFLANMSHEIRTPMNGILGFTELLKNPQVSGEQQQKFIEIIHKSGNRMLETVNAIIDISHIETGQTDLKMNTIDIKEETESLYSFFSQETEKIGLKLEIEEFPSGKLHFLTDKSKFNSIFTNLIKNAIKFTIEGSIKIGYKISHNKLHCYVKDTGIGIPKDKQHVIFNRFEQADIEDTRAYEGSGLGLAIAKAYVEMLGGDIGVESEEGKGSTFWFNLPDGNEKFRQETNGKNPEISENIIPGKLKIIIAEDDEVSAEYLSVLLKDTSEKILVAATGKETVELCKKHPDIDLILMDIKMPEGNGYDSLEKIRKFNGNIKIIAQTANALSGDREEALKAGFNEYISKPIRKEELMAKIDKLFIQRI